MSAEIGYSHWKGSPDIMLLRLLGETVSFPPKSMRNLSRLEVSSGAKVGEEVQR